MAWLHTWAGLLAGWVLFFVFLTGTFGYLNSEIDRWMRPELPLASPPPPASSLLPVAERYLARAAAEAGEWYIQLPGQRGVPDLTVNWEEPPRNGEDNGAYRSKTLDALTGEPFERKVRETAGGGSLYYMHYTLHYLPYDWATRIVGISAMFMLVAILSGIVTHKKIFKDFFTFRPGKGQRSWLDGHNLLSITALPFHLMITWTGLVFYMFSYMPVAADVLYPQGNAEDSVYAVVRGDDVGSVAKSGRLAPLIPIAPLLAEADREWGAGKVRQVVVEQPGRANARITISPYAISDHSGTTAGMLRFDGVTGERLPNARVTAPGRFNSLLLTLHEGLFANGMLRLLFVTAGLAGTAMIGTGLVLWSAKRKAKLSQAHSSPFGVAAVDVLNIGTIVGLPIGIAAYFWANRLIPVSIDRRGEWEIHAMFIAWATMFLYAIWRRQDRAWIELARLAAAAWGLLPLVNAFTTDRHLGVTGRAGDWALAGIDLAMLTAGLFFAFMAKRLERKLAAGMQKPQPRLVDA